MSDNNETLQGDGKVRAVYPSNLRAMCKRISGMAHRFQVERLSKSFAWVQYSNPDEWANDRPMTALFPRLPDGRVVLEVHRVVNETADHGGEGWQSFIELMECPELWRSHPDADDWRTRGEIEADIAKAKEAASLLVARHWGSDKVEGGAS